MQHRRELGRVDFAFVDQQHAQLRIAVLLDHEHMVMLGDEIPDLVVKRKGAHAHCVKVQAALLEHVERFVHCRAG